MRTTKSTLFSFKEDKQQFLYSLLLLVNILGLALIVIDHILAGNISVEGGVESLSTEFLFLFGIDLLVFLPIQKYVNGVKKFLGKEGNLFY